MASNIWQTLALGPAKQPAGIPSLRLVEEMSEQQRVSAGEGAGGGGGAQVEMFQGAQMMGRGVGNVNSKVGRCRLTL